MTQGKKIKNSSVITVTITKEQRDWLDRKSCTEWGMLSYADIIRTLIDKTIKEEMNK